MGIHFARYFLNRNIAPVFILLMWCTGRSFAQVAPLSGTITDAAGEALAGVSVRVEGSNISTLSSPGGKFTIQAAPPAVLLFSYIGFESTRLSITAPGEVNVTMKTSSRQLDQVVVTAGKTGQEVKRLSVSTEIIKPYLIENKGIVNLEKLMDQVPGVNVIDGQVSIRGGSGWTFGAGSRVLVMLDDMPYMSGDAGQVQWKFLPTENVEQIEVIKGASSVLYGSSALNGTINIRTASPGPKPRTGFTTFCGWYDQPANESSRWTSERRLQYGFNAFRSQRVKRLDLTASVNYLKDEGYRFGEDDHRIRLSVLTNYHPKKLPGLAFGINGSVMNQQSASFLLWDSFPQRAYISLDTQRTNTQATSYSIDPHADLYAMGFRHRIRARFLNLTNDITNADTSRDQDNSSWTLYGEYQLQRNFFRQIFTITAGITGSYVESNAPLYGGIHTQTNTAPYLQADIRWKRLNVVLGMRNESFRIDSASNNRTIYRAGINIEVTRSTFIRASYGDGYRYPSIAERYITTSVGSLNIFPNPSLDPETGWNAEAGIKQGFRIGEWSGFADIAYFHTEYNNMVEFNFGVWKAINFLNILPSLGFKPFNVGRTQVKGWDLSANASGNIGKVRINMIGGLTFIDAHTLDPDMVFAIDSAKNRNTYKVTSTDTSNNELKYRYDRLSKFDLEVGYSIFSAGVSMRYSSYIQNIDKIFVSLPLTAFVGGIAQAREMNKDGDYIWDARLSVQATKQVKASIIVSNLTNHVMMTRPADLRPPRLFMLQVALKF